MDTFVTLIQVALAVSGLIAMGRVVRGPTLADRIIALDLVLLLLAGAIAAEGQRSGTELYVPALIVIALVAFVGTVLVARFIEWRDVP